MMEFLCLVLPNEKHTFIYLPFWMLEIQSCISWGLCPHGGQIVIGSSNE